jgi:hypothetical protein
VRSLNGPSRTRQPASEFSDQSKPPETGFDVHSASESTGLSEVIDVSCLGCKRSRVQISPARPNFSKTYRLLIPAKAPLGVHLASKLNQTAWAFMGDDVVSGDAHS